MVKDAQEAKEIVLAPINLKLNVDVDFTLWARKQLLGNVLAEGGITQIPFSSLNFALPMTVVKTQPKGVVIVTPLTYVKILEKPLDTNEGGSEEKEKMKEILKEKIIIKIRCPHCRSIYDETIDRCPHCNAPHP